MTLEQAILVFLAATEELQRHSAIGIDAHCHKIVEIHLYELDKLMELPGELVIEEHSVHYPFQASKIFAGIKMYCLCKTDPREEGTSL